MKITCKQGKWKSTDIDALIVPMVEKEAIPKGLPKYAEELLKDAIAKKEFSGKARQIAEFVLPVGKKKGIRYIYVLGIGKPNGIDANIFGELFGQVVRSAQGRKVSQLGFWYRDILEEQIESARHLAEVISEYGQMSAYEFSEYFKKKKPLIKSIQVYVENKAEFSAISKGIKTGSIIGSLSNESRDLCNHPSNELFPKAITAFAKDAGKTDAKLKVKVFGEKEMEKLGMGAILGVSKGSAHEAQFVILEYWGGKKTDAPYVIVGKGVTFDTGGISIKPSRGMEEMKYDMCGAASALGVARTASALNLPINVIALAPAAENMPGQSAYKPGDVLTAKDGSTIEVLNTDAEGRLLLADALVYARDYKPKAVIDLATLTGACAVALHDSATGMFTKDDELALELTKAGVVTGDVLWRLPIPDRYRDLLKSSIADIANIAAVPYGGAITAASFLQYFVAKKYPWVHLDIAGVAWSGGAQKHLTSGATGAGMRAVVEWLRTKS